MVNIVAGQILTQLRFPLAVVFCAGRAADRSQQPSVYIYHLPVHEIGCLRGKKNCNTLQIIRVSPTAGRCSADDKFMTRIPRFPESCGLTGGKIAGTYAIYLDMIARPFGGHVAGEHF